MSFFRDLHSVYLKLGPLKVAAIIFFALTLFILVIEQPGSSTYRAIRGQRFFIPEMRAETVTQIELLPANQDPFILKKEEGKWMLDEFPADSQTVQVLVDALQEIQEVALVSKNPEKQSVYDVTEGQGDRIKVWKGDKMIADFYVGESNGLDAEFIRRADSDEVVEGRPPFRQILLPRKDWVDKTLIQAEAADINRITLKTPKTENILELKNGEWFVIQPEEYLADPNALGILLASLNDFKADDVSLDEEPLDAEDWNYKISLRLNDSSLQVAVFGERDADGFYPAQNGEADMTYYVSQEKMDQLFGVRFR